MPRGWPIVGWVSVVLGVMVVAILGMAGPGEDGIRIVIRATARTSVALFTAAFVASALRRAWPHPVTGWLLANRRYLGVSFAVSHLFHLLAILALSGWSFSRMAADAGPVAGIAGGIGYLFVAAMAATSFDRTAAWLGPRRWTALHTAGVYWLWAVFFVTVAPRVFGSPLYALLALGLLAALVLRLRYRPRALPIVARAPA